MSELLDTGNRLVESNAPDSAILYYITLSGKYQPRLSLEDKYLTITGYIRAGDIYYNQGNYHSALDLYFKAFRICESDNIQDFLPEIYKNMGNIYNKFEDLERGLEYYEKGLKLSQEQGNTDMEWKILNNLVGIYSNAFNKERDMELAWKYYYQMNALDVEDKVLKNYYDLLDLGYIYSNENKPDSTVFYLKKALDYAVAYDLDTRYISSPSTELAFIYEEQGDYDQALHYHLISDEAGKRNQMVELRMFSLRNLSYFYDKIGDKSKSLAYRNQYLSLSDSIYNMREFHRVKNMQMVYEMEKVNQKMDSLNQEKEESEFKFKMQRRITLLTTLGLLLFVILLIIVSTQKRKLEDAYVDLFERNKDILKSDKLNRDMRMEYERKLQEEKAVNQKLRQELNPEEQKMREERLVADDLSESDPAKAVKLSDEQKEKIASDISRVMENSLEFCDCDFSLNRLASLIGSNTKYVSQIINDVFHKNFRTYINEYRIKEACQRLLNTEDFGQYTIKAIAESVGYKSHTTFILIFKQHTGINPSTYQKIAQKQPKPDTSKIPAN